MPRLAGSPSPPPPRRAPPSVPPAGGGPRPRPPRPAPGPRPPRTRGGAGGRTRALAARRPDCGLGRRRGGSAGWGGGGSPLLLRLFLAFRRSRLRAARAQPPLSPGRCSEGGRRRAASRRAGRSPRRRLPLRQPAPPGRPGTAGAAGRGASLPRQGDESLVCAAGCHSLTALSADGRAALAVCSQGLQFSGLLEKLRPRSFPIWVSGVFKAGWRKL